MNQIIEPIQNLVLVTSKGLNFGKNMKFDLSSRCATPRVVLIGQSFCESDTNYM